MRYDDNIPEVSIDDLLARHNPDELCRRLNPPPPPVWDHLGNRYGSAEEAAESVDTRPRDIRSAIKMRNRTRQRWWFDCEPTPEMVRARQMKSVANYQYCRVWDENGRPFFSIADAALAAGRFRNSIVQALDRPDKACAGLRWFRHEPTADDLARVAECKRAGRAKNPKVVAEPGKCPDTPRRDRRAYFREYYRGLSDAQRRERIERSLNYYYRKMGA